MSQAIALDVEQRTLVIMRPREVASTDWALVFEEEGHEPCTLVLAHPITPLGEIVGHARLQLSQHVPNRWLNKNWPRLETAIIEAMQNAGS